VSAWRADRLLVNGLLTTSGLLLAREMVSGDTWWDEMANDTRVSETIAFLRMAAIELRRMADHAFRVADQLRHTANQCDREADDLAAQFGASTPLVHLV